MDLGLADKVILVSGGASGIGEAIVRELAAEGALPLIVDRNEERAQSLAKAVSGKAYACDLTNDDQVRDTLQAIRSAHPRLDGLINNAGVNDSVGLNQSCDRFRSSLEKNLVQCFALVHHALPALKEAQGSILNIGSKVAFTGQGGTSGYAASKGGLAALTREWALDLAADAIRVNAIIPAEVWTPMYADWLSSQSDPEARKAEIEARIPFGKRMTLPEEIAAMAVFLLSSRSAHTTGQIIHVDGGYTHLDRAYST